MENLHTTIIEFDLKKFRLQQIGINDFSLDRHEPEKIYWIHCNLNNSEDFRKISDKLKLPDEVVKACDQEDTMSKLADNDDTLTMQIQCLLATAFELDVQPSFGNLIIHLTNNYCFTASSKTMPALVEFLETCEKTIRYAKTPCFILFIICDNVINDYSKILFNIELVIEKLDSHIRDEHRTVYSEVMDLKQQVMKIKRNAIAMREILVRISDKKMSVISQQCRLSLYTLSNHTHMLVHETDSIRDMLNGFLDQIDNALMQNMNKTMRVLTAFAAIFLPLTLITGIYGMNFHWMPELEWKYGYFYALCLLVLCGGGLLYLFKKKKWF